MTRKELETLYKRKDRKRFGALDKYIIETLRKEKTFLLIDFVNRFDVNVRSEISYDLPSFLSGLAAKGYIELIPGLNAFYIDARGRPIARVSLME